VALEVLSTDLSHRGQERLETVVGVIAVAFFIAVVKDPFQFVAR
jgi:hypothetical protein